jgi:hypothetical protein
MKHRTLIMHRSYFGIGALKLREGCGRVASRIVGLPAERARVSALHVWNDFGVDAIAGHAMIEEFVAQGMLQPNPDKPGDFFLTDLFLQFATARVVEPLPRPKARQLVTKGTALAAHINAEWTHNPFEIEAVAPFGSYMTQEEELAELDLGIVVRPRTDARRSRWRRMTTKLDGANEIRAAFRNLSSFVHVQMVKDRQLLPRPFAVVFQER